MDTAARDRPIRDRPAELPARQVAETEWPAARFAPDQGARVPRRRRTVLRSAGVRFGVLYAALFGSSALALVSFLWWATAGLLDRQVVAAIRADAQGMREKSEDGGLPALVLTIRDRLAENVDDDAIYLLADARSQRIAGNLQRWPAGVTMSGEWFELPIEREGSRTLARIERLDLPGGFRLLVGRDVHVRARLRGLLTDALLWTSLVVVVLGAAGAFVVRGLFQNTLADVSRTAKAIGTGDLSRRIPISGRGDEFDHLAEIINDMLDRITRLMGGVRQVSNAIAHDLRTPIARARVRLEDAALHAKGEIDLRAAIERAQEDLDGIISVFQALLRIAEIEAGARRSAFAAFDMAPVLADLVELYGAVADERGMHLKLFCPDHLPAFGDRELIQQAVANLLDNAIKFSPPGGLIRLDARRRNRIQIVVADRGPGIPEADRQHATDRFFRGNSARDTPGSGLGLSLVLAVAALHGGELLLLDNNPGLRCILTVPHQPGSPRARS